MLTVNDHDDAVATKNVDMIEPSSYEEALQSAQKDEWIKAMTFEIDSLKKRGNLGFRALPTGNNLVSNKWVFKIKKDSFGKPERFKARLVARGFSQQQGVDYEETFAPTSKVDAFCVLLQLAISKEMKVHHIGLSSE